MKRNLRKAFTIVELVIVIAVIAILAAVLIPTFVNVTKSAKENADTQLVRNLNTALASDTDEHPTMHSALAAAEAFGYSLDKINAKASDNEILWDSVNDCFVYLKDGVVTYIPETKAAEVEDYQLWQIADEIPETQRFSVYAGSGFKSTEVTVSVGFDAGSNTAINSISYETSAEQTVVIRSNGGTVTVNAENSTVNHYGKGTAVDVQSVASTDCYHEYGTILGAVNLKSGALYVEAGANVSFIHITAESADAISVVIAANAEYGYVTAKTEELLSAVLTKVTSQSAVKSLVGEGEVAVVLNGEKTYAKSELNTAISDFTATEGAVFELFMSIDSLYFNDTNEAVKIVMPANGTILGHGYQISGAIAVSCNAAGGTVKGVEFYASYNNAQRTQEQIDRYGNASRGTLSSLYAGSLSGKLTVADCIFDSADWEAIQITPVKGAEIVITGNVFKHPDTTWTQNRYIHVESSKNVDFQVTVTNNDFYDISSGLTETAIEIYYPSSKENISISGNYFDGIDITFAYTSSTFQSAHISCIGYKTSYQNYCEAAFNGAVTKPNR